MYSQNSDKGKPFPKDNHHPVKPAPDGEQQPSHNSLWRSLAMRAPHLQLKQSSRQSGDAQEREARQVADAMASVRSDSPNQMIARSQSSGTKLLLKGAPGVPEIDNPEAIEAGLRSSAQPLDRTTAAYMEMRFGHSFSGVRVHADARAATSARAVRAAAYTMGNDIVFQEGQYAPNTATGRKLLAHELTHVMQQRAAPSPVVQRAGWSDAASGSPNAGQTTIGKMRRIPVSGLKEGNQAAAKDSETKELAADSGATDDPRGRAIVIVPQSMTSPPDKVEVLLHLHGHNVGYRARKTQGSESGMDKGAMAPDTVRDVTVDKIESQMEAAGRQMIAVLPQGTTKSGFGAGGLDSTAFINEALAKVAVELKWPKTPAVGNVALSAHSGGGGRVAEMLPVGGSATKGSLPAGMKELVLLDAINGPNELARVKAWTLNQLDQDLGKLSGKSEPDQLAYLQTSMRLRARYTPKFSVPYNETAHAGKPFVEEGGKKWLADASGKKLMKGYGVEYEQLDAAIINWFKSRAGGLTQPVVTALRNNYEVKPAGHGFHDAIVGRDDALLKAIKDLP